jgi:hypothetical protein
MTTVSPLSHHNVPITDGVRVVLRLEGLALLAVALLLYRTTHASWWLFAGLFLLPDVSFAGYLFGPRIGALAYNAAHSTIGPLALAAWALARPSPHLLPVALIWLAHVGFDRALGYGLKKTSGFRDTHLGRIGRSSQR